MAAWPGSGPMQKLKRAAAHVLSDVWPKYQMHAGPLGNFLIECEPLSYQVVRQANGGLTMTLGESTHGFLIYERCRPTEAYLRLKLDALLSEYPIYEDEILGLAPASPAAAPAANPRHDLGAATTTVNSRTTATINDGAGAKRSSRPETPRPAAEPAAALHEPARTGEVSGQETPNADPWVTMSSEGGPVGLPVPVPVPVPVPMSNAGTELQETSSAGRPGPWTLAPASLNANNSEAIAVLHNYVDCAKLPHESAKQLLDPAVQWVHTSTDFESMLQHCYAAGQAGLAAHGGPTAASAGKAEVAAVYVPAAEVLNTATDPYGTPQMSWLATVYLINCSALFVDASAVSDSTAVASDSAVMLRALLESPSVVKVAHGCEKVSNIVASCGAASVAPFLDTRVLLRALTAMLPPLPAAPAPLTSTGAFVAVGPLAAAAMSRLNTHVTALRDALVATGLWAQRPALSGRYQAALKEDTFGLRDWASNPAAHEAAMVVAAKHLPELWEALANEAIPWVAMAAAATAMESAVVAQVQRAAGVQLPLILVNRQ
ncbi:hypothetical protein VaNZ11_008246 [Volvox africanus]|uniref:3'-5' exonuclease domain-containing protein n=1 Tax=Volvox africanus TaxID=51714 RepID=A0ABQ5S4M9_9CHLO|nr:hypothetical protein VaNZ11_008246 [Volvox africanus]